MKVLSFWVDSDKRLEKTGVARESNLIGSACSCLDYIHIMDVIHSPTHALAQNFHIGGSGLFAEGFIRMHNSRVSVDF